MRRAAPFVLFPLLFVIAASLLIVFSAPIPVLGAGELDGALVTACDATGEYYGFAGACQLCDLVTVANNVIRFAVAFSVIVATLMFAYAGVLYFTAAASEANIKKAHGIFSKVFAGLVIILLAWLIVDIVMKTLTGGQWGPWHDIQCIEYPKGDSLGDADLFWERQGAATADLGDDVVSADEACPSGCVALQVPESSRSCIRAGEGQGCLVTSATNQALVAMRDALQAQGISVTVTAAIGGNHQARCQNPGNAQSGTCVDLVASNMRDVRTILKVSQAASAQGLRAELETNSPEVCRSIRAAATAAGITMGPRAVFVVPHATGNDNALHYSVYLSSANPPPGNPAVCG